AQPRDRAGLADPGPGRAAGWARGRGAGSRCHGLSGGDRLDPFVATVLRLTRVWAHALAGDGAAAKRELGAADRLIEAHPGLVYAAALRTAAAVELALRAGRVDRAQALLHARAGVAGV